MYYNVNTIYPAWMGEVNCKGIGSPCVFVRLSGCNLRCYSKSLGTLCDTPEALTCKSGKAMTTESICLEVASHGTNLVCLTGGEPLLQNCEELLWHLSKIGIHTVVETNGSKLIQDYKSIPNVSFVMDWKSPSSGEREKMLFTNLSYLGPEDYLKFVIRDNDDFVDMLKMYRATANRAYKIAVGTFWGSTISYEELMKRIKDENLDVYLNCQQHKMCMMYDKYRDKISEIFIPKEM